VCCSHSETTVLKRRACQTTLHNASAREVAHHTGVLGGSLLGAVSNDDFAMLAIGIQILTYTAIPRRRSTDLRPGLDIPAAGKRTTLVVN
jgi:hypothetical protein